MELDVLLKKSKKLLMSEQFEKAEKLLTSGIQDYPEDLTVMRYLALVKSELGKMDEAEMLYQKAIANENVTPDTLYDYGLLLESMGKLTAAEIVLNRLLLVDNGADALNTMGTIQDDLGNRELALEYFERSFQADKTYGIAALNLGMCLVDTDPSRAIKILIYAEVLVPQKARVNYFRGEAHENLKQYELAENQYRIATEKDPEYIAAWAGLAAMLHKTGQEEGQEAALVRVIELDPEYPNSHLLYGRYLRKHHRFPEAANAYSVAISLDNTKSIYYIELGLTLRRMGQRDQARQLFAMARQLKEEE